MKIPIGSMWQYEKDVEEEEFYSKSIITLYDCLPHVRARKHLNDKDIFIVLGVNETREIGYVVLDILCNGEYCLIQKRSLATKMFHKLAEI